LLSAGTAAHINKSTSKHVFEALKKMKEGKINKSRKGEVYSEM